MTFKDLIEKDKCRVYHLEPELENQQVVNVIAGDLMSEVLVEDEENLLLMTSLNSEQVLNTANIVDAACVLLVNGKIPQAPMIKMAQNFGISLLSTSLPMFEACKSVDN